MLTTKEEFQEWKQGNTTVAFFAALKNHREVMKEDHMNGLYENADFAQGKAAALKELIEMTYEDFQDITYEK